jgi:hypothetical protein
MPLKAMLTGKTAHRAVHRLADNAAIGRRYLVLSIMCVLVVIDEKNGCLAKESCWVAEGIHGFIESALRPTYRFKCVVTGSMRVVGIFFKTLFFLCRVGNEADFCDSGSLRC